MIEKMPRKLGRAGYEGIWTFIASCFDPGMEGSAPVGLITEGAELRQQTEYQNGQMTLQQILSVKGIRQRLPDAGSSMSKQNKIQQVCFKPGTRPIH